jgi:ribosomal protein S18 acetylase RimI-like enzyme
MIIKESTSNEKKEALKIAADLKEWFTPEGLKNIELDFKMNSVLVAKDNSELIGFLCYTTYCGKIILLWMGVSRKSQRNGVGNLLLKKLEEIGKELGLCSIEVETLPDEDSYEPYKLTRAFYYKNGFKRVLYKKARVEGWDDQIVLEKTLIFSN